MHLGPINNSLSWFFQTLSEPKFPPFVPCGNHRLAQGVLDRTLCLCHEPHRYVYDLSHHQKPIRHQALSILQYVRSKYFQRIYSSVYDTLRIDGYSIDDVKFPMSYWPLFQVGDRLLSAFGQDTIDALFWTATERHGRKREHVVAFTYHSLWALVYVFCHTVLVLLQATTLNVAINASNKALLTIMMSNNVSPFPL